MSSQAFERQSLLRLTPIRYFWTQSQFMAENKTKPTDLSVTDFIATIDDEQKQKDVSAICEMMQEATGASPKMWGGSIIGFGDYHYKYESGREGDWFQCGFSPRKANIALYGMDAQAKETLLPKLGKHKTGKGCLYINRLSDVNTDVLRQLIRESVTAIKKQQ